MIALLIIPLAILAIVALKWGLSPYFIWKKMAEEPFNDTFTIITLQGKQPLSRYLEEKQKQTQAPQFSMVIPAYNEVKRLPNMLPKAIEHFEKMKYSYEIVIVNDASKDKTTEVALSFAKYNGKPIDLKVLEYTKNQGKGGAVRTGCMAAVGDVVLMIDADGASEISEFEKCLAKLRSIEVNGHALVAGSRNHEEEELIRGRFEYRMFMSKCSNFIVQTIISVKLKDTQCGFKLFTNKSAKRIFKALHIRRWAFDVELFVIADYAEIPYCEIPISYTDQEDSKLNIVTDTIQMARDYLLIRLLYIFGLWTKDHSDNIWEAFIPSPKVRETTRKSSPVRAKRE